jgi:hypothetical protein
MQDCSTKSPTMRFVAVKSQVQQVMLALLKPAAHQIR